MKLLIFILSAFSELSFSIPFENKSTEALKSSHSNKIFAQLDHKKGSSEAIKRHETKLNTAVNNRDYIFLSDLDGKVIIIDATTHEEVISYSLPEISLSISAIVDDTFYNINPANGTILSTSIGNVLEGPDNIIWALVGAFPNDTSTPHYIRCSSAVNGSLIYFVTNPGNLYYYDTILRVTFKVGKVVESIQFASLVVVGNVLYIHKDRYFYSFNGTSVTSIPTPHYRYRTGLYQQGNDVCLVGAVNTLVSDPNLVYCYNPTSGQWSTPSQINFARGNLGVVTIGLRTYIFGGYDYSSGIWLDSVEVLNHETNFWGFIPTPLIQGQQYVQALAFNF